MQSNRVKSTLSLLVATVFAFATLVGMPTAANASATSEPYNLMLGFDPTSSGPVVGAGLELGTRITTSSDGYVVSVKYYRFEGDTTNHIAHVWDSSGALLATKAFTNETASGWQIAYLSSPVHVLAGQTFIVSDFSTNRYFIGGVPFPNNTAGPLTKESGQYVYTSEPAFPQYSYGTNYLVDLDFYTSVAEPADCDTAHGTIIDDMCTITFDGGSHAGLTPRHYYEGQGIEDAVNTFYAVQVPASVTSMRVTLQGGTGTSAGAAAGGLAARFVSDYPVVAGHDYRIGLLHGVTGGMCQDETQLASGDSALFEHYPYDFMSAGGGGSAGCSYNDGETTYDGGAGGSASAAIGLSGDFGAGVYVDETHYAGGGEGTSGFNSNNGGNGNNPGSAAYFPNYAGGLGGYDADYIYGGPGASGVFGAGGGAGGVKNIMGGAGGGGGGSYSGSNLHTLISYELSDTGSTHGYAMIQFPVASTSLSSEKDILTYGFSSPSATGTVYAETHTVAVTVPYGTDVSALVAGFTLSTSASAKVGATDQSSGTTANNFGSAVTYTVTAEDGSTQDWVVTVTIAMADTSVSISSPTAGAITAGSSITPGAGVTPNSCSTSGSSAITWVLDKNPLTGAVENYDLSGSSWSTSAWHTGSYTVTATYPGSASCNGSSATVSITVNSANTNLNITAPSSGIYLSGVVMTGAVNLSPSWATGTVTWSLDKNPLTGAAGNYNLTGNVWSTSKWLPDVYTLTANYGGSFNSNSSQDSVIITIAPNPTSGSAVGGGWLNYSGAGGTSGGRANFGFEIHKVAATAKTPAYFKGQLVFIQKNKWKVKVSLSSFVKLATSPTTGVVTGVAAVWRWDATLNGGVGDWVLVTNQAALEVKFQASVSGSKQKAAVPGQFGITLGGFTVPLGLTLPSTALQPLQGGSVSMY